MFEYKIQEELLMDIRHAAELINSKCTYTPIWYLSENGTVSKNTSETGIAIPTTFQINDMMYTYVDSYEPYSVSYFIQHVGLVAFYYPECHLYEALVLGLSHLLVFSEIHQKEKEQSPKEDPFTN